MEGRVSREADQIGQWKVLTGFQIRSLAVVLCYGRSFVGETLTRAGRSEFSLDWRVSGNLVRAANREVLPHITHRLVKPEATS